MLSTQSRIFLAYLLMVAVMLVAGFGLFLAVDQYHHKQLISANEIVQISLAKKSLVRDFEQVLPDVEILANERHLQKFIGHYDEGVRQSLISEFESFALNKRWYRTISFLDMTGHELVRVDYRDGQVHVIPDSQLQDKAERYYFKASRDLGRGELYISPIDLNIEHGRIETPYTPTIRFAMPVYDDAGTARGVLVLNYLAELMLQHFDDMLVQSAGHIALLNHDGYWIRSHKHEREWGFMTGSGLTFSSAHPEIWEVVHAESDGQILNADGLFSHTTVYPIDIIGGYSEHEVDDEHVGHHHIDPKSYQWKIVSDVPAWVFSERMWGNVSGTPGVIFLGALLLGGIGCWRYSIGRAEKQKLLGQIELHAKLYASTTEGVLITDPDCHIVAANNAFSGITGYAQAEVLGKTPGLLSSGEHGEEFYKNLWSTLEKTGNWEGEIINRRKDGGIFTEWLRISAVTGANGQVTNYVAIFSDITSKKASEKELQRHAYQDPLTGLSNRLSFKERLDQDLARVRRSHGRLALLYIDLDKFKPVNDTHGHQAGDALLREIAQRLKGEVRDMDTVARVGGDEFIVLLAEVDTAEHAAMVAGNLRNAICHPVDFQGATLQVDASIGVAVFPDNAEDADGLLEVADGDMYARKKAKSPSGEMESNEAP